MRFERCSKRNSIPPSYIEIKKSTIKGAGKGTFAKCDIPKGVTIGEYLGQEYSDEDANNVNSSYLYNISKNGKVSKVIDGKFKKYSSWVRYVNSPKYDGQGNTEFYQYAQRGFLKTTKVIPAGQEIFVYYGDSYIDDNFRNLSKDNVHISTKKTGIKCK